MAIEFRCTQCNKLLRTGEGTAGKQAKCPECGAILTVPAAGTALPGEPPPPEPKAPPPGDEAGSPFAPGGPQPAGFDPENPYAAPSEYGVAAPGYVAAPGALGHAIIDFGDVFSRTWAIFKEQWPMCLAVALLGWILSTVVFVVLVYAPVIVGVLAENEVIMILGFVVGYLFSLAFMAWMMVGVCKVLLRIARGEEVNIAEIFSGASHVIPVFLAGLLIMLIGYGTLFVFMLPGLVLGLVSPELGMVVLVLGMVAGYVLMFIVMLMFSQAFLLIIDRNVGVVDSLKISKQITTGNKLTLFLLWLVGMFLYMVSLIPCGLGIFVSIPFFGLMIAVVYLAMTGQPTADQMLPRQPTAP